jgi:hypothetical protein
MKILDNLIQQEIAIGCVSNNLIHVVLSVYDLSFK